jgi:dinuclear metal center YbgI/SA1388 family protein
MKVSEIIRMVEGRLPPEWCEEWDNAGLMIGDPDAGVSGVAVSLDATPRAISEASARGCGMLITHHPAIFRPVSRLAHHSFEEAAVSSALALGVAVYSAHTNWDSSPEGVNVTLSRLLGLSDVSAVAPGSGGSWGIGVAGALGGPLTLRGLAVRAKAAWRLTFALVYGDADAGVSRVAVCGGAGGDLLAAVINIGADVFITADLGYHRILDAQSRGLGVISVGHGEMESAALPALCKLVSEAASVETVLVDSGVPSPIMV